MNKVAFLPGRFSPPHRGHIQTMLWLLEQGYDLIVGIGSCYEVGRPRHPLLAIFREKMIRWSLIYEGADMARVSFVHLQDFNCWDLWWQHITNIPQIALVTHFVTGNEKDILSQIAEKKLQPKFDFINPEKDMADDFKFGYHATDLRQAIINGDYALFEKVAATGTVALMGNVGGFRGIRRAMLDAAPKFVPGRQTVDLIIFCNGGCGMVLCGRRSASKKDFPDCLGLPGGGINDYESPLTAAIREVWEETGLKVEMKNSHFEPAHIRLGGVIAEMRFVGLFGTDNPALGGSQGGSSQVFAIDVDGGPELFQENLRSESDLTDVKFRYVEEVLEQGLAYQQNEMLKRALTLR